MGKDRLKRMTLTDCAGESVNCEEYARKGGKSRVKKYTGLHMPRAFKGVA